MFTFADYIFNEYFTLYDKISDPNKDVDGKGTHERFNEQIGAEIDAYLMPLTENMQTNLLEPLTALDSFIPYLESMLGYDLSWAWFFASSLTFRRNLLRIIIHIYQIRGTRWAHEIMFGWLGLAVTLIEVFPDDGRWDDGGSWDDGGRWDTACATCTTYNLIVTGSAPSLTSDQIAAIGTIVEFNRPINAVYTGYVYNPVIDPLVLWTSPILTGAETSYAIRPSTGVAITMAYGAITFLVQPEALYSNADELTLIAYFNSLRAGLGMTGTFLIVGNDICYQQGAGEAFTIVNPVRVKPKKFYTDLTLSSTSSSTQDWLFDLANSVGAELVVDFGDSSSIPGACVAYDVNFPGFPIYHIYGNGLTPKTVHVFHDDTMINFIHFPPTSTVYRMSNLLGDLPASIGLGSSPNGIIVLSQKFVPTATAFTLQHCPNLESFELTDCDIHSFVTPLFGINTPNLKQIVLTGNHLSSADVDQLFNDFVANTPGFVPGGTWDISGQAPSAPPTGASAAARAALIANGWIVTTD